VAPPRPPSATPSEPGRDPSAAADVGPCVSAATTVAAAFGAVANGGEYIEPRVLRAVYRDGRRYPITPKIVRRTISAETAATLTTIMEAVVTDGTAKLAQIGGYTIAGKTGTASKLIDGRYSASENNASFAGFLPSRNPAVTIVVVIDAPHAGGSTGGVVAAPIFKRIAEFTLRYLGVGPTIDPEPPVLVDRHDTVDARTQLRNGPPIVSLVADGLPGTVPNLHGLSAREAVRTLAKLGLTAHLSGDGFVVSQNPPAGAALEPGAVCSLVLNRWGARSEQVVGP